MLHLCLHTKANILKSVFPVRRSPNWNHQQCNSQDRHRSNNTNKHTDLYNRWQIFTWLSGSLRTCNARGSFLCVGLHECLFFLQFLLVRRERKFGSVGGESHQRPIHGNTYLPAVWLWRAEHDPHDPARDSGHLFGQNQAMGDCGLPEA